VASNPSAGRAAGETLFLVQGSRAIPALRAGVNAAEVRETAVETSLRQLQQQSREQLHLRPRRHSSRTRRRWEGVDR
jgi:hypothetical protein